MSVPVSGEQHERAVEAVARALWDDDEAANAKNSAEMGHRLVTATAWTAAHELDQEEYRRLARGAIDAYHRSLAEQGVRLVEQPKCPACKGSGETVGRANGGGATDGEFTYERPCPDCNGTGYVRLVDLTEAQQDTLNVSMGDHEHPDWGEYVASNLLQALRSVPDTGDWHAAVRTWCERNAGGPVPPSPRLVDLSEVVQFVMSRYAGGGEAHGAMVDVMRRFGGHDGNEARSRG